MKQPLSPLRWMGGKQKIYPWILKHLPPPSKRQVYVEPFAGMLSVLLNRRESGIEIINDANDRVVNFWRVVRESPDDLHRLLRDTPHAKSEYLQCKRTIDEGAPLERARKFVVSVSQGMIASDGARNSWLFRTNGYVSSNQFRPEGQLRALSDRMRHVQIDNGECALTFIRRVCGKQWHQGHEVVIYCDPPYQVETSVRREGYRHRLDYDAFAECLRAAPDGVKIAVSGYPGDYDRLGWRSVALDSVSHMGGRIADKRPPRTEMLWMNYESSAALPLLDRS